MNGRDLRCCPELSGNRASRNQLRDNRQNLAGLRSAYVIHLRVNAMKVGYRKGGQVEHQNGASVYHRFFLHLLCARKRHLPLARRSYLPTPHLPPSTYPQECKLCSRRLSTGYHAVGVHVFGEGDRVIQDRAPGGCLLSCCMHLFALRYRVNPEAFGAYFRTSPCADS